MTATRRAFVAGSLVALAAPFRTDAQMPRRAYGIGVFHLGDHVPPALVSLRDALKALGYIEGRNVSIDFRNVADEDAAHRTAIEFVTAGVDIIVAIGNPTVRAAIAATRMTPIVMLHVVDPVAQGFVKSLSRPGGNVTGFVYFAISPAKHVELFKEIVPGIQRLLVLIDPRDPDADAQARAIRAAAEASRLKLIERPVERDGDLENIFSTAMTGIHGVIVASINIQIQYTALLVRLTANKGVPLAAYWKESVREGALFSYAADVASVGHQAAGYVDRIFKGAKPADLPVQQPTKFELVINLKTAKALGLTIPPSLLLRADQVIE